MLRATSYQPTFHPQAYLWGQPERVPPIIEKRPFIHQLLTSFSAPPIVWFVTPQYFRQVYARYFTCDVIGYSQAFDDGRRHERRRRWCRLSNFTTGDRINRQQSYASIYTRDDVEETSRPSRLAERDIALSLRDEVAHW